MDEKLAAIHADPAGCREFLIADAKDADMAFGIGAPGRSPEAHAGEVRFRTLAEYREQIREIVRQGLVDIMLMSASTNEVLTIQERLFDQSHVTPAARANDTSDIFVVRGGDYAPQPSRPSEPRRWTISSAGTSIASPQSACGREPGAIQHHVQQPAGRRSCGLGGISPLPHRGGKERLPAFPGIVRSQRAARLGRRPGPGLHQRLRGPALAGVAQSGRPLFLKMVYHGPKAMEELVAYDPHLVVGILGGSAGTTYDAFKLIAEAQKYGARVALFGRKINNAENQLAFVEFLRRIVERQITPEEAVRAYHGVLEKLGIKPHRRLEDDVQLTTGVMSYGSSSVSVLVNGKIAKPQAENHPPGKEPDFGTMNQAEKLAWQKAKRDRIFGSY